MAGTEEVLGTTHSPPRAVTTLARRRSTDLLTVTAKPTPSGAVVVAVCGEVDQCSGPPLRDAVLAQVRPAAPALVIDLTDVEFFGAAGLTVLIAVRDAAKAARIRLSVIAHARVVLLPLTITGLDRMFDIYPALADAPPFRDDGPDGWDDHA